MKHSKLFCKLLDRSFPLYIVKFIAYWYSNQEMLIRWGAHLSVPFRVSNGIKQGGIISPLLFNVYIDELSANLNNTRVGCYAGDAVINHLSYADDMVLLAPSARALKTLLKECESYAASNDIIYNTGKTKCMVCWPKMKLGNVTPFSK